MTPYQAHEMVARAALLATELHEGQVDKNGRPYVQHLRGVSQGVEVLGGSLFAVAAGFLHDSPEDQAGKMGGSIKHALEFLRAYPFPGQMVDLVDAVTKRPHEPNEENVRRIDECALRQGNPDAHILKAADHLNNLRPDRWELLPLSVQDRLGPKYRANLAHHLERIGHLAP